MTALFEFDDAPMALERSLVRDGYARVAGTDEVGRGALAGPVVAAAAIMSDNAEPLFRRVRDSKKLSPAQREELFPLIHEYAVAIGIGIVEAEEIDRINILQASLKAMKLAVAQLAPQPDLCLIDGNTAVPMPIPQRLIIKGDDRVFSIAAASIVAKVTRDRLMVELAGRFPSYGFAQNKGYGSGTHLKALEQHGPCPFHRRSFAPAAPK